MHEHIHVLGHYGYTGLFLLLAAGIIGIPVPDETMLAVAGYEIAQGRLGLWHTLAAAFLGSVAGITVSYWLGRSVCLPWLRRYGASLRMTPRHLDRAQQWFARIGKWALIVGYFVPGARHMTAIAAGASRLALGEFALFAYAGALLWTWTFVFLGLVFGQHWTGVMAMLLSHRFRAGAGFIAAGGIVLWAIQRRRRNPPSSGSTGRPRTSEAKTRKERSHELQPGE